MANERPSGNPGGYWMAGTPTSAPTDAYQDFLRYFLGGHGGNALNFPSAPPAFPEGGPQGGASQFPYSSDFAELRQRQMLANALTVGMGQSYPKGGNALNRGPATMQDSAPWLWQEPSSEHDRLKLRKDPDYTAPMWSGTQFDL